MARQAGRLLAELRRASNEFKSQIETEIAHLEVQKSQTVLSPAAPPPGSVASLSLNPAASESIPHKPESAATLAAPTANAAVAPTAPDSTAPTEAIAEPAPPTSQESHV